MGVTPTHVPDVVVNEHSPKPTAVPEGWSTSLLRDERTGAVVYDYLSSYRRTLGVASAMVAAEKSTNGVVWTVTLTTGFVPASGYERTVLAACRAADRALVKYNGGKTRRYR